LIYDAVGHGESNGTSTVTWNHTIGSGNNRRLDVLASISAGSARTVTAVTYNGVALTHYVAADAGTVQHIEAWYLLEASMPAAGTYVISVSFSGTGSGLFGDSISHSDAYQGAPEAEASNAAYSSSHTLSVTTITDGAVIYEKVHIDNTVTITADDGQTQIAQGQFNGDTYQTTKLTVATAGATPVGQSWVSNSSYAAAAIAIAPGPASSSTKNTLRPMQPLRGL